ncbi:hypothetical protein BV394_00350 [Brevirhabdus pacifica]|uniref:Uncharacterized protein n=3 Tax=Brevirhabdus pacifica TaxID=1267768 RepID=A0A1U7DEI6_9RHOB|nr:hypothetical protein BV394_00350 [Brevirhabdus pacifica]PJJ87175.1 hypothetical protein CLV77_1741 [Brevirhabdus pacifica]
MRERDLSERRGGGRPAPEGAPARPGAGQAGSRFLYEPFEGRRGQGPEILERVLEERWAALEYRLGVIDTMLVRLDRRLWLTVFGVLGAVLTEAVQGLVAR